MEPAGAKKKGGGLLRRRPPPHARGESSFYSSIFSPSVLRFLASSMTWVSISFGISS
jgi:hypothetical protein